MPQNPPNRIGTTLVQRLGGTLPASTLAGDRFGVIAAFAEERTRWPLWLPAFLGAGIAWYFALETEPVRWLGLMVFAVLGLAAFALRSRPGLAAAFLALAAIAMGFAAIQARNAWVAAPVLERPSGAVMVEGLIEAVELRDDGSQRVTLSRVSLSKDMVVPERVRIVLKPDAPAMNVGERMSVRAALMPPPHPAMPGSFDFARHAWFQQLGAVGSGLGPPQLLGLPDDLGTKQHLVLALAGLRQDVTERIRAALPGDEGGVAAALVTGDKAGIPKSVLNDYRDSGLAHLLAISGLHMTLVAGLVFFVVRGALALVPRVALRHPIKKWAAIIALFATFGYMLLAGAPVPAQRAFLMTAIVLLAVLLDRKAISMRLVAWAAMAVLLVAPETLVGPSFQMSFAAVVALIAAYELAAPRLTAWRSAHPGLVNGLAIYGAGIILSTLVAGTATAVYGIYHFNRFSVFSVLANLMAVPLTGFVVMPSAILGLLLMPLGLEHLALTPMGFGIAMVNRVASWVSSLPGAAITLPVLPLWGLALFTLGGLWLCLWRRKWRLWGLVAMAAGLGSMALDRPPDVLIEARGNSFAVRMADGSLLIQKGGRFLRDIWSSRAGPAAEERWPKASRSRDGRLACDKLGCVYRIEGWRVALVLDEDGIEAACSSAEAVLSAVPIRQACRGARVVVDRFDLWRRGAHALWLDGPGGVRMETVSETQGDRPWSYRPVARKKKTSPSPEAVDPAKDDASAASDVEGEAGQPIDRGADDDGEN